MEVMEDRANFPQVTLHGESKSSWLKSSKEFKCTPKWELNGKFIRERITLHRQSVDSSQRKSERAWERLRNRDRNNEKDREGHWEGRQCSGNSVTISFSVFVNYSLKTFFTLFFFFFFWCYGYTCERIRLCSVKKPTGNSQPLIIGPSWF